MKKTYDAPKIEDLGSFETLTKAATTGSTTDAVFPSGTPLNQLTFS